MSDAFSNNLIDTELQVRLMNLVLGEASDFERDQLQVLMEQRAELADYYQHLRHLHGLLGDVALGEPANDIDAITANDAWLLPSDKREQLLAVLDGKREPDESKVALSSLLSKKRARLSRWSLAALAVTAAAALVMALMLPSVQSARLASRQLKSAAPSYENAQFSDFFLDNSESTVIAESLATHDMRLKAPDSRESAQVNGFGSGLTDSKQHYDVDGDGLVDAVDLTKNTSADDFVRKSWEREVPMPPDRWHDRSSSTSSQGSGVDAPKLELAEKARAYGIEDPKVTSQGVDVPSGNEFGVDEAFRVPDDGSILLRGIRRGTTGSANASGEDAVVAGIKMPDSQADWAKGKEPSLNLQESDEKPMAVGAESSPDGKNKLFGDVQTEFIEDLDLVVIKGAQQDVERTKELIQQLKEQGDAVKVLSMQGQVDNEQLNDALKSILESKEKTNDSSPASEGKKDPIGAMVESYNDLMSEGRYAEAEVIAKSVGDKLPEDPQLAELMKKNLWAKRDSSTRERKADNSVDLMNAIDQSDLVTSEQEVVPSPEPRGWRLIAPRKGFSPTPAPSPEVASSARDRVDVRKPVEPKTDERKTAAAKPVQSLDEQSALKEAFSTFSMHVSDVSFKLAQSVLAQGQWPESAKIRIEEFVNAIDYHDPLPSASEKVACRVEQSTHPFLMQRNLLRVSLRTAATGRSQTTPLRLTVVLDNSGSMERPDRRQAVLQAFQSLTTQLTAADQVTLISFASTPRLLAEKVPGNQGQSLLQLIEKLPSEGGTNIEAALTLAREKAAEQKLAGAQNRIVLLTDGAVNLGNAQPESLAKIVTQLRDAGIAFDAAGIGAVDLNDEVLEALTRQGDGRYYLLDSAESAGESFAAQIAGALRPSAQNVKVQVEFNPQRVGRYKLLGFEKHRLNKEDFRNDQVDAAELAAAEAGVAVYHFEIKPNGSGDIGSVSVRFRDVASGQMIERRWPIPYEPSAPRLEQATPTMQLATCAALFAAKLSGGPLADSVDMDQLDKLLSNLSEQYASQPRVQQLRTMIKQAKDISGKR